MISMFSYGLVMIREREKLNVSDVLSIVDTQRYIQKRDYHIMKGQRKLEGQHRKELETTPFQYNKEYLFDVLDKSINDYVFAGNLKTGKFMYSHKMMVDFGLPSQVLENAAAVWGEKIYPEDANMFFHSNQEIADGRADRHTIVYRAKNGKGEWIHLMCRGQWSGMQKEIRIYLAGLSEIWIRQKQISMKNCGLSVTAAVTEFLRLR